METGLNWSRAITAFCQTLLQKNCQHIRCSGSDFCQDCGEYVQLQWVQLRCRGCNTKRLPQKINEVIKPVHRYCKHCGCHGFRQIAKTNIEPFELIYSVGIKKVILVQEDPIPAKPYRTKAFVSDSFSSIRQAFYKAAQTPHIVEGQVVRKQVF